MGAGAGSEDDSLTTPCDAYLENGPVVDDDRSRPTSDLNELTPSAPIGPPRARHRPPALPLAPSRSSLRLRPVRRGLSFPPDGSRDIDVRRPGGAGSHGRPSSLGCCRSFRPSPSHRADYRAPFDIDREGRHPLRWRRWLPTQAVGYRLLVTGELGRVAGLMTTAGLVREIADASAGAALFASAPVRS